MKNLLDRGTLLTIASAFVMVVLCLLPATQNMLPFSIIRRGAFVGDALFHEMGHTIFFWLFGQPAIPMIFTLFGSDQAGGMSLPLMERNWFVQIAALLALTYGCYWAKQNTPRLFIPAIIFSLVVAAFAASRRYEIVIGYMGHGGSIAMGGFFLYRAWIYLDARNGFERWLNAFFGFYLTLSNLAFSYVLAFDRVAMGDYSDHVAFGASHNDFAAIASDVHGWSVKGIAIFTIGYVVCTIIAAFIIAACQEDPDG